MRKCFPWRIGVIYNFVYGKIDSAEIRIGTGFGRYKSKGKKVLFSWLDVSENKKMLREIISDNSKYSIFSRSLNKEKSINVRDLILNNKYLSLDVIIFEENIKSFPTEHGLRENFVAYPYSISSNSQTVKLYDRDDGEIIRLQNVVINFSPDILKYLSTISY